MQRAPGRHVVLVGASNLAQGLGFALGEAFARLGEDTRVLAACGRGRSYGLASSFLGRGLPPVLDCGLWRALDAAPRAALLADVGNDLAYGVEPERVLEWVRETATRLGAQRLAISGLPYARLARLSPRALAFWGRVIFPARRLEPERVLASAAELDRGLDRLARELGATRVELDRRWYGLDPIHFARAARPAAWSALCAAFGPCERAAAEPVRLPWSIRPERWTWLGRGFDRAQPCWRSAGGAELSLF